MYCMKCGNQIPDDSTFCDKCGATVDVPGEARKTGNPVIVQSVEHYAPPVQEPKKKRAKAVVILSVITAIALVGCGVLGLTVLNQSETYTKEIDDYKRKINGYETKINWMDNNVVLVGKYAETFHRYGCSILDKSMGYHILDETTARKKGYRPCPICSK